MGSNLTQSLGFESDAVNGFLKLHLAFSVHIVQHLIRIFTGETGASGRYYIAVAGRINHVVFGWYNQVAGCVYGAHLTVHFYDGQPVVKRFGRFKSILNDLLPAFVDIAPASGLLRIFMFFGQFHRCQVTAKFLGGGEGRSNGRSAVFIYVTPAFAAGTVGGAVGGYSFGKRRQIFKGLVEDQFAGLAEAAPALFGLYYGQTFAEVSQDGGSGAELVEVEYHAP